MGRMKKHDQLLSINSSGIFGWIHCSSQMSQMSTILHVYLRILFIFRYFFCICVCSIVIYEISAYILTEKCLVFRCLIYKFLVHLICTGLVVFDNLQNKINPLLFVFPANSILLTVGQIPFHNKKYQRLSIYTHLPF